MKNRLLSQSVLCLLVLQLCTLNCWAQKEELNYAQGTFRGTRIINGHSAMMLRDGEMEVIINHRFGRLNGGAYELYGLDESNIRIGFDYGLKDWLNIGIGRSSLGKELDGFLKIRLLRQAALHSSGMPISVTLFSSAAFNTLRSSDPVRPLLRQDRLAYVAQLYLARKLSDRLSLQLSPTYVHYNLVETAAETNDKLAMGLGSKIQLSKNWAMTSEYYYVLPNQLAAGRTNAFSVGFDLNTGSHVFQFHLTNSSAMIEKQFIGETNGDWFNGDIHLGFNMVRTFKLKGRRY